ncbi:leukemia inhibitory factor receptor-like [Lampris incognitus]|uniref:leukemia inhibitory factor receptor-like n=1 Tax=Lampris incognitus TaxID=2546036 RepID=UPI0024B551A0|nr:leukemia inhibitory factor receptor-like [Lampris incognitus]
MKDYVRYHYLEHRCIRGIPQTVKMCLFYKKQGVPTASPKDFRVFNETKSSVELSWTVLPTEKANGTLTHYTVCSMRTTPQKEANREECHNVSALQTHYRLEKLTPGVRYQLSLAAMTVAGAGPKAFVTTNTVPEKLENSTVLLSIGVMTAFLLTTIICPFVFKRIKNKIFPPVPVPVIATSDDCQPDIQMPETKEEVHELTLQQSQVEDKHVHPAEELERKSMLGEEFETDNSSEEDPEVERMVEESCISEGTCDKPLTPCYKSQTLRQSTDLDMMDLRQGDVEDASQMYRNGLVFVIKTDNS